MDSYPDVKKFIAELKKLGLYEPYMALPPAHRREYYKWVNSAKKPATRYARLDKMRTMILGQ